VEAVAAATYRTRSVHSALNVRRLHLITLILCGNLPRVLQQLMSVMVVPSVTNAIRTDTNCKNRPMATIPSLTHWKHFSQQHERSQRDFRRFGLRPHATWCVRWGFITHDYLIGTVSHPI
jgi:hypothetical protein